MLSPTLRPIRRVDHNARMALSRQTLRAVRRYGPSVQGIAQRRYGISGEALLAKLVLGESGDRSGAVSSAGARGKAQFTSGSRRVAIQRYGIDPWRSTDEAVHAASLHLRGKINGSKGLAGYNPGDPSYTGYILGQKVGNVRGAHPGVAHEVMAAYGALPELAPGVRGMTDLLGLTQHPQVQASAPAEPAFSARASLKLPGGYQPVASNSVAPRPSIADALRALAQSGDPGVSGLGPAVTNPGQGGSTGMSGAGGRVRVASGADRAGVRTHRQVLDFASRVSEIAGTPVKIGTGTNHSRLTVDGNVSDHWSGWAADIPATGRRLIRLGQAALIAAGMPRAQARRQRGGLYNFGGAQIIFNTQEGGDHTTHLHIRPPRGRR